MKKFTSFLAPQIYAFMRHRLADDTSYYDNLILFDQIGRASCRERV